MINEKEIPREQWGKFLEEFSRMNAGGLVDVDVRDPSALAPHAAGVSRPLERIAPDRIQSGDYAIIVKMGGGPGEHVVESVYHPVKIVVEQSTDGVPPALRIESSDGMVTVLRFRSAHAPMQSAALS